MTEPQTTTRPRKDSGVGAWLKKLREDAGLPRTEVAARMGVERSQLAALECGYHDIRISTVLRYANAIGARVHIGLADQAHTDTSSKEA
ncbi:MAG TPA: helix-turn-helix transcriptional regulator [Amycolatopsis sp.]|nr:helix-turn-helix transcriptional regulator [Amycolatopsis sp.]